MTTNTSRPTLESQLAHARETGDAAVEASLLVQLGDMARGEEEYDLAQGLYGQAWAASEQAGDISGQVRAMRILGDLIITQDFEDLARLRLGEQFLKLALDLADSAQDHNEAGYVWSGWARFINPHEEWQRQRQYLETARACFERAGNLEAQADTTADLANMDAGKASLENKTHALKLYKNAIDLYAHIGPTIKKAGTLNWYGHHLIEWQSYAEGYPYLQQALSIYEILDHRKEIICTLEHMGEAAMAADDYIEARRCFRRALSLIDPDERSTATPEGLLTRLGWVSLREKNYVQADEDLKELIAFCEHPLRSPYPYYRSKKTKALIDLAWVNCELGHFDQARVYHAQASQLCRSNEDYREQFRLLSQRAYLDHVTGSLEVGMWLRRAYDLIRRKGPLSTDLAEFKNICQMCEREDIFNALT